MSRDIALERSLATGELDWLNALITPEPWMQDALCREVSGDDFFPDKNDPGRSTTAAKKLCAACDVRAQCLEYALRNNEKYGVWGMTSERERRKIMKERAA